jgi:n-acylneuraminate cytidylyltransferase (cmp-n-acetylneuraminic acid synthetase) (cmp-neunac synthetase) (cmp-sialic acid synthetase)
MKNIAIIPARSGTKGLPDKNIRLLNEKPLIAYSIEAALESGCFEEIMLSTDSEKYAEIGRSYGAKVPFLRSQKTASDSASSWDTVEEVLDGYLDQGREFETFCLLQPTSPLRTAEDIREAYLVYEQKASFAVVSVCEAEHSPLWCGTLPDNHEFIHFVNENSQKRRQDSGKFYRINGALYIVSTRKFATDRFLYREGSFAYIMPQERSVDIDTEVDFKLAELMVREKNNL